MYLSTHGRFSAPCRQSKWSAVLREWLQPPMNQNAALQLGERVSSGKRNLASSLARTLTASAKKGERLHASSLLVSRIVRSRDLAKCHINASAECVLIYPSSAMGYDVKIIPLSSTFAD